MTNEQLYLALGVPIVVNAIFNSMLIGFTWMHFNTRIDDMRDMLRHEIAEVLKALVRVEGVLDARIKHIEEKLDS